MWTDLRDFLLLTDTGWWIGWALIVAGIAALGVYAWRNVQPTPVPRKLGEPLPRWHGFARPDADTGVVPRIPGATPQEVQEQQRTGPVCPVCGAAWHGPVCPAPKERSDETVEMWMATEPEPSPVKPLAPQYAALSRFFASVDEARADTDTAMRRLAANARPDCPLTTHELVIPTVGETPVHRAIADREPTQELSEAMKKVSAP